MILVLGVLVLGILVFVVVVVLDVEVVAVVVFVFVLGFVLLIDFVWDFGFHNSLAFSPVLCHNDWHSYFY